MISSRSEHRAARPLVFLVFFLSCFSLQCIASTISLAGEHFPLYPTIRTNVQFWEDVYSRYSTRQGILHDRTNLGRIYAVIDLVDTKARNSEKTNSERIDVAKNRINAILTRLGSEIPPRTAEERKIASLFPNQRHAGYHEAKQNIRLQIGQSDRFKEGLIRSGRYIPKFRQIFASHGLPPDLVYLPHVESSFNPKAYSKAGAAGLWQFTRSTGKEYMVINELVDERYDPYIATDAAARFLKENHKQLDTWPLALTAYNYGRAGMVRAVREKGSYENIFKSYHQGHFKFAARNFYPCFLAAMRVAKRAAGNPKIPFERPEATVSLRLKEDMPIVRLRSSFRLSAENFARINPALRKAVLNGEKAVPKGYLVRLPAAKQGKTSRTL
jgi:membrane-bound lytic murein transglycosylase D